MRQPIDYLRPPRSGTAVPEELTGWQLKRIIGANVERLRIGGRDGYSNIASLHELGFAMGYPPESARQAAWRWEQGESLSFETLGQLATVLGVDPAYLLTVKRRPDY